MRREDGAAAEAWAAIGVERRWLDGVGKDTDSGNEGIERRHFPAHFLPPTVAKNLTAADLIQSNPAAAPVGSQLLTRQSPAVGRRRGRRRPRGDSGGRRQRRAGNGNGGVNEGGGSGGGVGIDGWGSSGGATAAMKATAAQMPPPR
jgi:hypothetical protein